MRDPLCCILYSDFQLRCVLKANQSLPDLRQFKDF